MFLGHNSLFTRSLTILFLTTVLRASVEAEPVILGI